MPAPGADAHTEQTVDQGAAERSAAFVAGIPVLGKGGLGACVDAVPGEAGGGRDETHHAAFGAGSEQRALRSTQHFHALEIEHLRKHGAGQVHRVVAALQRGVVDVHTRGRGATVGIDAAYRDPIAGPIGPLVAEVQTGCLGDDIVDLADVALVKHLLRVGTDADRDFAQLACLLGRRNDDLRRTLSGAGARLIRRSPLRRRQQ